MHDLLAKYIKDQKEKELKIRNEALIKAGLFEKQYDVNNRGWSEEYHHSDDKGYYKKVPILVSDEEWNLIKGTINVKADLQNNKTVKSIRVVGIVLVCLGCFVHASQSVVNLQAMMNITIGSICILVSFILNQLLKIEDAINNVVLKGNADTPNLSLEEQLKKEKITSAKPLDFSDLPEL